MWRADDKLRWTLARLTFLAAFFVVLALAFGLRAIHLQHELVQCDEAFSWRIAMYSWPELWRRVADDVHPVLHFAIVKSTMMLLGDSPFAIRLPSVVAGVLVVASTYWLFMEAAWSSDRAARPISHVGYWALTAAFLVSIHALHIESSRTARMYSFATLFATGSGALLLRALRLRAPSGWLLYSITVAMLLHTHYFGLFVVSGQAAYILGLVLTHALPLVQCQLAVVAYTLSMLCWLPVLPVFLAQAHAVHTEFWITTPTLKSVAYLTNSWLVGIHHDDLLLFPLALALVASLAWLMCQGGNSRMKWFLGLNAFVPWIMTVLIATLFRRPLFQDRYLLLSSPAFLVLLVLSVASTKAAVVRLGLMVNVLVLMSVGCAAWWMQLPAAPPSLEDALAMAHASLNQGDIVVLPSAGEVNVVQYYSRRLGYDDLRAYCPPQDELKQSRLNMHFSSLQPQEFLGPNAFDDLRVERVWVANGAVRLPGRDWRLLHRETFPAMHRYYTQGFQWSLFERVPVSNPGSGNAVRPRSSDRRQPEHETGTTTRPEPR